MSSKKFLKTMKKVTTGHGLIEEKVVNEHRNSDSPFNRYKFVMKIDSPYERRSFERKKNLQITSMTQFIFPNGLITNTGSFDNENDGNFSEHFFNKN